MNLKDFLRRNLFALTICLLLGLAAGRAFYNHAMVWQLPSMARLALTLALLALVSVFSFFAAYRFGWQRLQQLHWGKRAAWLLLSLGGGALLLYGLSIPVPVPEKYHALEISVTGQKNPAAQGRAARLLEISLPGGEKVFLNDTQREGDWQPVEGALAASGQQPAALRYYFKGGDGSQVHILFDTQPDGGKVSLRLDDFNQEIDLYEATPAVTQVNLPVSYNMPLLILLYAVDLLSLALLVFVTASLYRAWLQHAPRLALAALLIAGALALVFLGVHASKTSGSDAHNRLWWLVALFELTLALVLRAQRAHLSAWGQRLPFLIALAVCFILMTDWHVFYVSADSNSYTASYFEQPVPTRPPVYPLFIQAITAGTDYDHTTTSLPRGEPLRDTAHPLMRVAMAQQVILFTAALVACLALMLLVDAPLSAGLFLWLYDYGFFSIYTSHILSEPLTLAFMFLLVACFCTFLVKRWLFLLPLASACCALLYLTRPAGIFGLVILAAMFLAALYFDQGSFLERFLARKSLGPILKNGLSLPSLAPLSQKEKKSPNLKASPPSLSGKGAGGLGWSKLPDRSLCTNILNELGKGRKSAPCTPGKSTSTLTTLLASTILLVVLVAAPVVELYFRTGRVVISPMYYITRVAFALQVAKPEDVALMPDDQARQFLLLALQRKRIVDAEIRAEYPDEYLQHCWYILKNPYDVAIPVATEMIGNWYGAFPVKQDLMLRVAQPILAQRWQEYLGVAWKSFTLATSRGTRLDSKEFGFWPLMLVCLALIILVRGRVGYAAAVLILAHLAHLVIICLNDSPSGRYVEAAEFMVVMGAALLIWALLDEIAQRLPTLSSRF